MNKARLYHKVFYFFIRITLAKMLTMVAMTSIGFAAHLHSNAQDILDRKISLEVTEEEIKAILSEIEKQASVTFTYRPEVINSSKKVSLKVTNATVRQVLNKLFNQNVSFIVSDDVQEIVLKLKSSADASLKMDIPVRTVTGTITNSGKEPLPGVSIVEKGTTNGTTTSADGKFKIEVQDEKSILVFSYIGYITEEVVVGNQTNIQFSLVDDMQSLGEVVVVGYGEKKKETLTGSVANISGKEIVKSPTPNVASSLAGRLPGLIVNQTSGEPGQDDPNILIRGASSFVNGANSPLIIIDGVPRSYMGRLNPQDIESISVLKDASAAIYGARAANGVILITTRKGAKGKPVFDFSFNQGYTQPTKVPKVLDAATFAEVFNEAEWYRAGRPANWTPFYSDEAIQKFRDGSDPVLYPNTNWVKEVYKPYAVQQRFNLSANGGSDAVRYFLSFGSTSQDGILRNAPNSYKQYNLRVKVDVNLTKDLSIGVNLGGILTDKKSSATQDNNSGDTQVDFTNILHANPTLVARYPNGLIAPGRLGENPLLLDQRGYSRQQSTPINSSFTASYNVPFIKGLKAEGSFNYDFDNRFDKRWIVPYYYYEYNVNSGSYDKKQGTGSATSELTDTYNKWTTTLSNLRLNFDRTFDSHHVAVMAGVERQKNTNTWAQAYRKNFVSTSIDQIGVGSTDPKDRNNNGGASAGAYNNYFGRINYDFQSKYLLEFLFRYDGSQRFAKGKRYGFFPGISAGWRLSEEPFIRNNFEFINQLKLRASYGQMGNDAINPYQYIQSFGFGNNYVFGSSDVPGITPNVLPNPNITWEVSEKTDLGLEGSLWKSLLGFELTLFRENRSDILARRNVSISNVLGFPGIPDENIGKVKKHGLEVALTHKNAIGDVSYQVTANTSFVRNRIEFMDEVPQDESYKNATGHPVGAQLFYKADGIFNTQSELDDYPHLSNAQVGDTKIVDLNNDGKIDGADQYRFDFTSTPEYVFGLGIDLQYKNFDLSLLFQGQTNAYNYDDRFSVLGSSAFDNASVYRAKDRWTVDNPNGSMPRANDNAPGNNTRWVYDATFARLKNLELGYTIPESVVSKAKLSTLRIYVSGFNLLTWAKKIKWTDPEISGPLLYYPQQRVFNLGVNVKF
jgi:TonB-linked SusC/RagA family outer membrane protein